MTHQAPTPSNPKKPRVTGKKPLAKAKWLELHKLEWEDANGSGRIWESAERVGGLPAVMILAWLVPSRRLVLIRQYRPPADANVIEFPAGLIEKGEDPAAGALRELHEETGYTGQSAKVLPPAFSSPGLSTEAVHAVLVEIDETLPQNRNPEAHPESGENITMELVEESKLCDFLQHEIDQGHLFDSKVVAYILGLSANRLNFPPQASR